ncbi:MAG TPA: hypothetical protein DHU96_13805 [Actinobacteria bacterium]|nr:hypothetical protein [Actinomycetota bacterium]
MAWFIARRPGGAIAGALQYRHHAIQMFEGYAGTSSSGFRAEVEAEQARTRGEHLLAMTDHHEHQQLTGPAAAEAASRLASFTAPAPASAGRSILRLIAVQGPCRCLAASKPELPLLRQLLRRDVKDLTCHR